MALLRAKDGPHLFVVRTHSDEDVVCLSRVALFVPVVNSYGSAPRVTCGSHHHGT